MEITNDKKDFEFILKYQQGDEEAFSELFRKYYPLVYRILVMKGVPQIDAEDFTQEIFIKLVSALKTYRFEKPFENYLRRIVRNKVFDFHRKKQVEWYPLNLQQLLIRQINHLEQSDLEEIIEQCLQKLKSLIRRAIVLLWLKGYKRKQMAETLSLPLGTVHSNLERGKVDFRKCVQDKLR